MTDFTQARKNMIDCQIATMGVVDPGLLEIMGAMPRERFVPRERAAGAYTDEDLKLGGGGFLMEPLVFARLVQAGAPKPSDIVLNIADSTGYAAAVLSDMTARVVTINTPPQAAAIWGELSCTNITIVNGAPDQGCPQHAPYDFILINGSVPAVPPALIGQLAEGGRLLTILRKPGAPNGKAVLVTRLDNDRHSSRILFDAATPYVPELIPRTAFAF